MFKESKRSRKFRFGKFNLARVEVIDFGKILIEILTSRNFVEVEMFSTKVLYEGVGRDSARWKCLKRRHGKGYFFRAEKYLCLSIALEVAMGLNEKILLTGHSQCVTAYCRVGIKITDSALLHIVQSVLK